MKTKFDLIPTKKVYIIEFIGDEITLLGTQSKIVKSSQKIENIVVNIKTLHKNYIQEMKTINFEPETKRFLLDVVKNYLNEGIDLEDYYDKDKKSFIDWKNLLHYITGEIKHEINEEAYHVKVMDSFADTEKHTITIIIENMEDNRILQAIILLEEEQDPFNNIKDSTPGKYNTVVCKDMENIITEKQTCMKITVSTKMGVMEFKSFN